MKNITVSVDDETYQRARMHAAARDTSVSALVRDFLKGLAREPTEFERLRALEDELDRIPRNFSAGDRLTRDELYDRAARRAEALAAKLDKS